MGDNKYVVAITRPMFTSKKEMPVGSQNHAVIIYSLYDDDEQNAAARKVTLGEYRASFSQAAFPIFKVQVVVPRDNSKVKRSSEAPYRGRFLLVMVNEHLKVIDTQAKKLFDVLSEPDYDKESISGMGLSRSLVTYQN